MLRLRKMARPDFKHSIIFLHRHPPPPDPSSSLSFLLLLLLLLLRLLFCVNILHLSMFVLRLSVMAYVSFLNPAQVPAFLIPSSSLHVGFSKSFFNISITCSSSSLLSISVIVFGPYLRLLYLNTRVFSQTK